MNFSITVKTQLTLVHRWKSKTNGPVLPKWLWAFFTPRHLYTNKRFPSLSLAMKNLKARLSRREICLTGDNTNLCEMVCSICHDISLCMGTCYRRFRRAFFMKSSIFQRNLRLYIKNGFGLSQLVLSGVVVVTGFALFAVIRCYTNKIQI